jgi:integrase
MSRPQRLTKEKFLSESELEHLHAILDRFRNQEPRNTLFFELLLATGARPGELLNAQRKDLDPRDRSLFIHGMKGSNSRDIPLPKDLFDRAIEYAIRHAKFPDDKLFNIAYPTIAEIWRNYRPVKKALRSTRHTFAVNLFRRTKDLRLTQRALGHRWISTTEIYLDFEYDREEFRKLIVG